MNSFDAPRPWLKALLVGCLVLFGFVSFSLLFFESVSSGAAGVVAVLAATGVLRRAEGQEEFPRKQIILLGAVALALYTFALFTGGIPAAADQRLSIIVVFAIPAALLFSALRQKPQSR